MTAYLEFAELQALSRKSMTMEGWGSKLDDFLKLTDREVLTHVGQISHAQAKDKAESEYGTFKEQQKLLPTEVDKDFEQSLDELKQIEKRKRL